MLLRNAGLTVKESKCDFAIIGINYRFVKTTQSGIAVTDDNIAPIQSMPHLSNAKQVTFFLACVHSIINSFPIFQKYVKHFINLSKSVSSSLCLLY